MFNNEAYKKRTDLLLNKVEINYNKILEDNLKLFFNEGKEFDFNVIVPVRGRADFLPPLYESFSKAIEKTDLKINIMVIENSHNPDHLKFCKEVKIDYVWLQCPDTVQFNKCLCHNIGAIFSPKSKYYIFHDLDCLVSSDFFIKLKKNINNKKTKVIQNFQKRRVLYCSEDLTRKIVVDKNINVDSLNLKLEEITEPKAFGAPGGSITVERDLFFDVGGYDDDIFVGYAPEDTMFWDKLEVITKVDVCNKPTVDIFHMWHPASCNTNPYLKILEKFHMCFKGMEKDKKKEVLKNRSEKIKKYVRL